MADAQFVQGDPNMVDFTPSSGAVSAGQVVLLGNTTGLTCGIAHLDIANTTLGSLAVGGGVYDVTMAGNYAAWTKVWWDDAANKVTTTSTNNALFGYVIEGGTGANTVVNALHVPDA